MDKREALKIELQRILGEAKPEELRNFFRPSDDLEELVIKCILWGHYFWPKYFSKPTPEFHYDLVRVFFRKGNDYTACPRGFGKTTMNQLCIAYACANGLDEFIVLIEKTYTEAAEVLEAVREEFKRNDEVLRVYGDLTKVNTKGKDQENIKDSEGDFFVNGVRLRGKGFDTPIRGLKSRHSRPTRVIIDDCESDEHIDNVEQRAKYLNNYIKGVIPAVDNDTGVIKMFGTILHDDSLLNTLIKNHHGKIYRAWDENRELLWASNWTVEKLEQKREEMRIEGKGDASFYQEYFNEPLNDEDQIFRKEMFRYFNSLQLEEIKKKKHRIYTLVDPAISKKTTADFTAVISVLVDEMNKVYVLEITRARLDPMETIRAIFAHYERWNPYYVAIETTAYQKALKYFIEEEKRRQSSTVQTMMVVEIRPTIDKVTKIGKLQPKYAIANVFHNSDDHNTPILEQELLRFPKGVHDDVCFVAGTKVLTDKGQKNIEEIQVGDLVMTRKGLRAVESCGVTGEKEVIENIGLTGTPNHPVIIRRFFMDVVKHLSLVRQSDTLYIWNEKLSCIEEKSIIDTRIQNGDSIVSIFGDTISGKNLHFLSIAKYGLIILEKYLKNIMSIIKMGILLITKSKISNSSHLQITPVIILKKGGLTQSTEKKNSLTWRKFVRLLRRGIVRMKERSGTSTMPWSVAKRAVVYNLKVSGEHEYFANNILVHNCDCLSNVIEIIVPVSKTVERAYRKHQKTRTSSILY